MIEHELDKTGHEPMPDLPDGFQMTELGPLPEEWRVVQLHVLGQISAGGCAPQGSQHFGGTHPFVRVQHLDEDGYQVKRWDTITDEAVRRHRLQLFPAGTIIFPKSGASIRLEKRAVLARPSYLVSHLCAIVPNTDVVNGDFLFFALKHIPLAGNKAEGYPTLSLTEIRRRSIPLPPLPEQRAIAHVLRTVQRAKEATDGVIAALKELKKSLMQHLFTYGPVPVTERDRVTLQETEIGPIPAHWRVLRLGEVVTRAFGGGTPSTSNSDFWDGTIPWTTSAVIQNDDIELFAFQRTITENGLKNSSTSLAPKGSLLVGTRVGVGKAAVATFNVAINQDLTALILSQHVDAYFVAYLLKSQWYQSWFENNKRGATIKGVPRQDLLKLPIPLPPLDEQREIARILQTVDAKIAAEQARRAALETLFKSLLHHLMTGKVRVTQLGISEVSQDA